MDFNNFSLELFERDFQHQQPLVLTGLVPKWPATTEWTWEQLTDPKGQWWSCAMLPWWRFNVFFSQLMRSWSLYILNRFVSQLVDWWIGSSKTSGEPLNLWAATNMWGKYGRFQLSKHLTFYFSTHAQAWNMKITYTKHGQWKNISFRILVVFLTVPLRFSSPFHGHWQWWSQLPEWESVLGEHYFAATILTWLSAWVEVLNHHKLFISWFFNSSLCANTFCEMVLQSDRDI